MLKKLVKYGNSNALILDRAILELLNIGEGSVVKLHTDGKSLVITPQEAVESKGVFATGMEILADRAASEMKTQTDAIKADPTKNQKMEEWAPGTENFNKLTQAFGVIMEKYRADMAIFESEAFLNDVDALAEKYQGDRSAPQFVQDFLALRLQYVPSLADMDREMQEARKALGMPDYL